MENVEAAVKLSEIAQVALSVLDLTAAKEFYRDVLGMRFLFDAGTMAFFQCGTVRLLIGISEKPFGNEGAILYFRVRDIQLVHAALRAKGVPFVQEPHLAARMKSHDLWLAFLKDPDGNTLGLMSEIERTALKEEKQAG